MASPRREVALELLRERTRELEAATAAHRSAMHDAREAGATIRQIAAASGTSRAMAHKIVRTPR